MKKRESKEWQRWDGVRAPWHSSPIDYLSASRGPSAGLEAGSKLDHTSGGHRGSVGPRWLLPILRSVRDQLSVPEFSSWVKPATGNHPTTTPAGPEAARFNAVLHKAQTHRDSTDPGTIGTC